MILKDDEGDLEITVHEVAPPPSMRPGDFRVTVRVSTLGFGGTNDHVWIAADEFQRFVERVRVLERERQGQAELRSMSPEDFGLCIKVRDRAGHVTASGWGDWGMAVMLELRYGHPRTGDLVEIRQALRIRRDEPFDLRIGARAEIICWGVMPSGMLRHPRFVRWVVDERGRTSGPLRRGACGRSGARP